MTSSRFNKYEAYIVEGYSLLKLEDVSQRLNSPKVLTLDEQRDFANTIDSVLMCFYRIAKVGAVPNNSA